jgi:hypothetical protein
MQSIQIDGTYTYAENIKNLKIGEQIKLIANPNNRINSEAVGAYTLSGQKIGYVPFKTNQIDITSKYTITKIRLIQNNPILLISKHLEQANFIQNEPVFIKELKYKENKINNLIKKEYNLNDDLKYFQNYLVRAGNQIINLEITWQDDNFINLLIETPSEKVLFWTVTKKYYEENVFKYDEFFKFKLIPKCIYQQFQIHRLEVYLEKNYKSINKLLKMRKFKLDSLIKSGVFELFDSSFGDYKINEENFGFEKLETNNLKAIKKSQILNLVQDHEQMKNLIRLIIQFGINSNQYFNPNTYIQLINKSNVDSVIIPNLEEFKNIYNDLKLGGVCYNHSLKYYCQIDLYDDINIIDIILENNITKEKFVESLIKLVISNKQLINLYNPTLGIIYRLEIPELIKNKIINLISK